MSTLPGLPPLPPVSDIAVARAASRAAARYRAEWLININAGLLTPMDLLRDACTEQGIPLRRLKLSQVLAAAPGRSMSRAITTLKILGIRLGQPEAEVQTQTVGWLIDSRSNGVRFMAWLDAVEAPRNQPPWPGYPWQKKPEKVGEFASSTAL